MFGVFRQANAIGATSTRSTSAKGQPAMDYSSLLQSAPSVLAAEELVLEALQTKLAAGLGVPEADVDANKAVYAFGVDSLVALELRYWFMKEMKADLAVFEIMQSASLKALVAVVVEKSASRQDV